MPDASGETSDVPEGLVDGAEESIDMAQTYGNVSGTGSVCQKAPSWDAKRTPSETGTTRSILFLLKRRDKCGDSAPNISWLTRAFHGTVIHWNVALNSHCTPNHRRMLDRRAPATPSPLPAHTQDRELRAGATSVVHAASRLATVAYGSEVAATGDRDHGGSASGISPSEDGGGSGLGGRGDDGGDGSGPDDGNRRARYFARSMRVLKRILAVVTIVALIVYFVFGAVALALRYVVMPNVDRFRPRVEAMASAALHTSVHIGRIEAHWTGFRPTFTATDLRIGTADDAWSRDASPHSDPVTGPLAATPSPASGASAVTGASAPVAAHNDTPVDPTNAASYVHRIQATLSWRSLFRLQPILSQLTVDHVRVTALRTPAGQIFVGGTAIGQHRAENPYAFPSWLLGQREIVVQDLDLRWIDQAGPGHGAPPPPLLQLTHARLALVNTGRHHRFGVQGSLTIPSTAPICARTPCADTGVPAMPIDFRANFANAPFGAWLAGRAGRGNPQNWDGDLYLNATQLDVAALNDYVDNTIGARAGHADIHTWWQFDHGQIRQVSGSMKGRGLALQLRQGLPPLRIPAVDTQFAANQQDGDYHASVRNLTLELDDQAALPDGTTLGRMLNVSRFEGEYRTPRVGRGEKISLSGDVLDIGLLADFSRTLPLPMRLKRNIDRYNPSGVLSDYQLDWERDAPKDAAAVTAARVQGDVPLARYKLHARLDGVTLAAMPPRPGVNAAGHPHIGQPGFSNLRGVIDADQDGGKVQLDSHDASITIRGMFDDPTLQLDALSGIARWQIQTQGDTKRLDAHFDDIALSNQDLAGHVQARFRALLNASQDGYLDLTGTLDRANVPMVPRYLPTSIVPQVRQYLSRLLKAGTSTGATVEAHGRLNDLPYPRGIYKTASSAGAIPTSSPHTSTTRQTKTATAAHRVPTTPQIDTPDDGAPAGGTSTFRVNAPFTDATIDVSPADTVRLSNGEPEKWPAFTGLVGRFFVDGRQLGFELDHGQYRQARIDKASGLIADLGDRTSPLRIDSHVRGPLADYIDFVGRSPLGYWSHQIAAPAKAQGNASMTLHLDVSRRSNPGSMASYVASDGTTPDPATTAAASDAPTSSPTATSDAAVSDATRKPVGTDIAPSKAARVEPVTVSGTLHFERNRVTYGVAPPVENLTGDIAFTTHTGTSRNLQGRFLGGDIRAEGAMAADGSLNVQVRGHVAPERIASIGDPRFAPLLRRFTGTAPYEVQVGHQGRAPTHMTLRSDLTGLGIDLPAPLNKAADTPMSVSVDWGEINGRTASATKSAKATTGTRAAPATSPAAAMQRIDVVAGPVHAAYLRRSNASMPTNGANPTATNGSDQFSGVIAGAIGLYHLPPLPEHGVLGELHIGQLNADAWRSVVAEVERSTTAPVAPRRRGFTPDPADASPDTDANRTGGGWLPDRYDIAVDDLLLLSRHWHDVRIDGGRAPRQGWQAQIDSREVAGTASWQPQGGSALHARLTKLMIPAADPAIVTATAAPSRAPGVAAAKAASVATAAGAPNVASATGVSAKIAAARQQAERTTRTLAAAPQTTKRFPAIDLVADQFGFNGKPIGKLSLLAHNVATADDTVWQVDDLTLAHPAATLHASGDWRVNTAGTDAHTGVDFQLAIHDGGGLLAAIGVPGTLKGGRGSLDGALNWNGNPGTPDLKTLDGTVKLDLQRGQFLKVNPGAARLLGILSLQGLVRFLQLDFKSVFGKGLAFNSLSGTTTIHAGVARTDDATLATAPAKVTMFGTANVVDETQDFHVTVVPHLNAVSASIAAAIVNPVIGLGTLVAQLALAEPISRSLTRYYQVQGHWDKPEVRRTTGNRGNIAPTAGVSAAQQPAPGP